MFCAFLAVQRYNKILELKINSAKMARKSENSGIVGYGKHHNVAISYGIST